MKVIRLSLMGFILLTYTAACSITGVSLEMEKVIGDPEAITHLKMLDGNTGEVRVFIQGADADAVIDFLLALKANRSPDQRPHAGYRYWIAGYREEEQLFRFIFTDKILTYQDTRYELEQNVAASLDEIWASNEYGALLAEAAVDLADSLGISSDAVVPESVENVTFEDTSLGLPEEGRMYAQVLTPGYILKLQVGEDLYTYHVADEQVIRVPDE